MKSCLRINNKTSSENSEIDDDDNKNNLNQNQSNHCSSKNKTSNTNSNILNIDTKTNNTNNNNDSLTNNNDNRLRNIVKESKMGDLNCQQSQPESRTLRDTINNANSNASMIMLNENEDNEDMLNEDEIEMEEDGDADDDEELDDEEINVHTIYLSTNCMLHNYLQTDIITSINDHFQRSFALMLNMKTSGNNFNNVNDICAFETINYLSSPPPSNNSISNLQYFNNTRNENGNNENGNNEPNLDQQISFTSNKHSTSTISGKNF